MRSARGIALAWFPVLAYMGLIWFLSSRSISLPLASIPHRDKVVHLLEYGTLGALAARAIHGSMRITLRVALVWAFALSVGWGALDELHQAFVPGRSADALDLAADAVGTLLGIAWYRRFLRKRSPHAGSTPSAPPAIP
jgi:VanZ family protein